MGERVEFFGEYDLKECGLVIRNAQQQDAGQYKPVILGIGGGGQIKLIF